MLANIQNFEINSKNQIIKSGEEENGRIPIKIVISDDKVDKQGDIMSPEAFNEKTMDDFIANGIIDYDHEVVRGDTPLDRAKAMLGEPKKWYKDEYGRPVVEAELYSNNPYVRDAIMPALKEDGKVWKASVGGSIVKKSKIYDNKSKKKVNKINAIKLHHIAITPSWLAVNPRTSVEMIKSIDENTHIEKRGELEVLVCKGIKAFNEALVKSVNGEKEEDIQKALMAGYETNMANLQGGQALSIQSLEGSPISLFFKALNYIMDEEKMTFAKLTGWFVEQGLTPKEALKMSLFIVENKKAIKNKLQQL